MSIKDAIVKRGYAEGEYFHKCKTCGKEFVADKRAWNCFDCACKKADGDYAVLGDGWRDVRKELPDKNGDYLVFIDDGDQAVVRYEDTWWRVIWHHHILFWRPLPDPPTFA
jgi:ribosomal protein L37AE/L43A